MSCYLGPEIVQGVLSIEWRMCQQLQQVPFLRNKFKPQMDWPDNGREFGVNFIPAYRCSVDGGLTKLQQVRSPLYHHHVQSFKSCYTWLSHLKVCMDSNCGGRAWH